MVMFSRSTKPRPRHQPRVEALEERLALNVGTATPPFALQSPAAIGETNSGAATPAAAVDEGSGAHRIAPPDSHAYGKTLAEWSTTYWRWYLGTNQDLASSKVGRVQLMPLPTGKLISGSGTPDDPALYRGRLEITLPPGTPFVLPVFAWSGERYKGYPNVPDDPTMANHVLLAGVHPKLTIDGKTVLSDANKADYYVPPTYFDPIVVYPQPTSYGSVAAVFFQGDAIVSTPLTPGVHTIHLYEPYIIPAGAYPGAPAGFGTIYDNTWIVTVRPK